ncbi:MAG: DUF5696 domain-containing protein, partial [Halanaerobiales bacterium]
MNLKLLIIICIFFLLTSGICASRQDLPGFEKIAENKYLILFFKSSTTEIAVINKSTDSIWYSNPPDRKEREKKAKGKYKDRLKSQFLIEYLNLNNESFNMDSFNDSVVSEQYDYEIIEDGVRINYLLGDEWGPVYYQAELASSPYLPRMMARDKFEELIIKKLEEETDREYLRDMYYTVSLEKSKEDFDHYKVSGIDMEELFGNYKFEFGDENVTETEARGLINEIIHFVARGKGYSDKEQVKSEDLSYLKGNTTYVLKDVYEWDEEDIAALVKKSGCTPAQIAMEQNQYNIPGPKPEIKNFRISLEYYLEGEDLVVKIPGESITYPEDVFDSRFNRRETYPLAAINLLQYFGAANAEDNGYIFVPDGSGALINLNESKSYDDPYSRKVYGKDFAIKPIEELSGINRTNIHFPVYGLKKGDQAFFAVIEEGASLANIRAQVAGMRNSYNSVSANFNIMPNTKVKVSSTNASSSLDINMFQSRKYEGDIKIRFLFLNGDKANYSGMAKLYQNYLKERGYLKKLRESEKNIPLYLDIIGGFSKTKPVIGLPRKVVEPLTTYKETGKIIKEMLDNGINNPKIKYSGWFNGGIYHDFPDKVKTEDILGSKKDFLKLVNIMKENDIDFYPDISLLNIYQNSFFDGFNSRTEASRFISREIAYINNFDYATFRPEGKKSIVYSPGYLDSLIKSFLEDYNQYEIKSLSLRHMGEQLNSDFRSNKEEVIDRVQAEDIIEQQLKKMDRDLDKIMLTGGNQYVLPHTRNIIKLPMYSGNDSILDRGVPFSQMVLHGYINYTGVPVNLADRSRQYKLKLVETGAYPHYQVSYNSATTTKNSDFDYLYRINYENLKEEIVNNYNEFNQLFRKLQGKRIIDHEEVV